MRTGTRRSALVAGLLAAALTAWAAAAAPAATRAAPTEAPRAGKDSVAIANRIAPQELAPLLELPESQRPALFQVGFESLYRTAHIAGSTYAGPGSKPAGLRALRKALRPLKRDRQVVLYCGCCPWKDCPNVRPALRTALGMGFRSVRVLYLEQNLRKSGLDAGLPEAATGDPGR